MKPASRSRILTYPAFTTFLFAETAWASTEPEGAVSTALRVIWGMLVVVGILFILYGLMKKKMSFLHAPGTGAIKIVEVRHLMPKKALYLVEVRGREFLLGAGQDDINLIAALGPKPTGSFAGILDESQAELPQ